MGGENGGIEIERWLVTAGAVGLYFAVSDHIPLPGVAYPNLSSLHTPVQAPTSPLVFHVRVWSVIFPLALAEIARLALPPLARWVAKGPDQAALYLRIVRALALSLVAAQALGVAAGLRAAGVVFESSWRFDLEIVATYVGATAVLFWLIDLINAKGLGDGLVLLYAAPLAAHLPTRVASWWRFGAFFPAYLPFLLLALTLLAMAALIAVSRRRSPSGSLDLWSLLLGGLLLQWIGPWIEMPFATAPGGRLVDMFVAISGREPTQNLISLLNVVGVIAYVLLAAGLFALVAIRRASVDRTRLDGAAALLLTVEFVVWIGAELIIVWPAPLGFIPGFDLILCVAAALSLLPAWRGGRALAPG
jgi:hypothetical protein